MNLAELLIFLFGCTGLTIIIVMSYILEPIRDFLSSKSKNFEKLINCTMCTGFWVGLISSYWIDINPIFAASMVSLFSWTISTIVDSFNTINIYFDSLLDENEEENGE